MDPLLRQSYRECEEIARKRARNFYYAFTVLPKTKRQAMCAMYAFMRYCDDVSDSADPTGSRRNDLKRWRSALDSALVGDYRSNRIMTAFHDTVRTFGIPVEYFYELIEGAEMDLCTTRYATFEDLYEYCYRVASAVGLVCIHIFGFCGTSAKQYAEYCGVAFQLTNILRDIKEDADRGRIYIPQEDLSAFGYSEDDLLQGILDDRFRDLMRFQVARARDYYDRGMPLVEQIDPISRPGLLAMIGIYASILDRIEQKGYDVFSQRIGLSVKEKLAIAAHSALLGRSDWRQIISSGRTS